MLRVADECLYDVRDRKTSYARSRNCKRLDGMAMAYIQAGADEMTSRSTCAYLRKFDCKRGWRWPFRTHVSQ